MDNTQLAVAGTAPAINTGLSIFDSGTFDQMGLIASKLAASSLIPATLKGDTDEETAANCFRVVEQAQRWGLSPFAVLDSASVVHGKLMWEGKLIAAAIKSALGVRLRYDYEGQGDQRKVTVTGEIDGQPSTVEGTVADWKTTGKGSPWEKPANHDQMLAYRGARQWARRHAPEVILGVYSPDEFDEASIRNVTPATVQARTEPLDPFAGPQNGEATRNTPQMRKEGRTPEGQASVAQQPSQPTPEAKETQSPDVPPEPDGVGSPPAAESLTLDPGANVVKAWIESYQERGKLQVIGLVIDGKCVTASTFSKTTGSLAEFNVDRPCLVELGQNEKAKTKDNPDGNTVKALQIIDEEEGEQLL
jgi:hypothetical protein